MTYVNSFVLLFKYMQPVSLYQYTRVSGTVAGSAVVSARAGSLANIVIGSNKEGTVTFYDAATAAGTSATNLIFNINNNTGSIPTNIDVNANIKNGIVAFKGGTTDLTVMWN